MAALWRTSTDGVNSDANQVSKKTPLISGRQRLYLPKLLATFNVLVSTICLLKAIIECPQLDLS